MSRIYVEQKRSLKGQNVMSVIDPMTIMVLIAFVGTAAQALAAWWFKVSCHDMSENGQDFTRELRKIARLNARSYRAEHCSTCAVVLWLTGAYVYK